MIARLLLILTLLITVGCQSVPLNVKTAHDPQTDFSTFKSYAWITQANELFLVDPRRTRTAENTLTGEIDKQLQSRGLKKVAQAEADLVVFMKAGVSEHTETTKWAEGEGQYGTVAIPVEQRDYRLGSLIINLVDPTRKAIVWQGTADIEFEKSADAQRDIPKAIAQMFKDYPPQQ
ncbi:DUF4136 domain-containing protein [Mucisphaera calidilacus]|uniref:DUF4136 domain-containing protein n=1 Tax=Mucisphaera calidilacus TaxID=2527982 RepID=A0A518C0T4_9BACT|nr:DUF4136 domain-containing protein [Mucisphaera calidilacus]QDU72837.1 hypothetical protein Pan265_27130 [Mucisphaera calidilacus]